MNDGYIKSLDGVRALAIILVMTFHAGITHFGWMGVQLFFVLSGYLITGILWKEKFRQAGLTFKFKKFWVRRSLRIFPLYFGYLIVLGLGFLLLHFPSYYTLYAPYLFTYTFNYTRLLSGWQGNPLFTHLWSLSIEEQFYLFFPLIIFFLPARLVKWFLVAMIFITPVTRYLLGGYYGARASMPIAADAVYWNTLSHLDAFFMGGLIPVLSLNRKIKNARALFISTLALVVIAGLANYLSEIAAPPYLSDLGYNHDAVGNYAHVWRYSVLNLCFASFLLLLTDIHRQGSTLLRRIFENNILVSIGRVSYGMYIFHWLIFVYVMAKIAAPQNIFLKLLFFIPYLAAVYLVAALSYRLYEVRFLRLKDRLFRRTSPLPAGVESAVEKNG
ncbi:MAG TPA: acyltransferase [Flavisolibacter sp.]|nr:acyltransferase [Flavisolibacter sp.]